MTDILTRLKAATGADRDLDLAIWRDTAPAQMVKGVDDATASAAFRGRQYGWEWPHYTSDVSSALALVEAKLPGHGWVTGKRYNGPGYFAEMYDADFMHEVVARSDAPTAPLALLIALFTALEPLSDGHSKAKASLVATTPYDLNPTPPIEGGQ